MAVMDILITATDRASDVIAGIGASGEAAAGGLMDGWMGAGVAMAGAGVGLEALTQAQAPLTEQSRKLAAATGLSEKEIRKMAQSAAGAGDPLNEIIGIMELGRQQGLTSAKQLEEYAGFWDMVGDATGENAVALAQSGTALRVMGIDANEGEKALGALGFMTRETTTSAGGFLDMLSRVGPDLADMGMSIDDTAAVMGILEREMGLTGRVARTELNQAIQAADGDMNKLFSTLGITAAQFETYRGKVAASSGVISENSDIHQESHTIMQKLQHQASELTYSYGDLIGVVGNLSPLMLALSPIMGAVSAAKGWYATQTAAVAAAQGKATVTTIAMTTAMKALAAVKAVLLSPIFLVVAAIVALIAVGYLLIKNWDTVSAFLASTWETIKTVASNVWGAIITFFTVTVPAQLQRLVDWFAALPGKIGTFLMTLATVTIPTLVGQAAGTMVRLISGGITAVITFFSGLPGRVLVFLLQMGMFILNTATNAKNALVSAMRTAIDTVVTFFSGLPGRVWTFLSQLPGNMSRAGASLLTAARTAAQNTVGGFMDVVSGLPGRLWGVMLAARDKIGDIAGAMMRAARDAAGNLWEGFKSGLGIRSPSHIERAMDDIMLKSKDMVSVMQGDFGKLPGLPAPEIKAATASAPESGPAATLASIERILSELLAKQGGEMVVPIYLDGKEIARVIAPRIDKGLLRTQQMVLRAGGSAV